MIHVDSNQFCGADITDMNKEFPRFSYPFVLFMNDFSNTGLSYYHGIKNLVRPGGYFVVYKDEASEQLTSDLMKDVGKSFTIQFSEFDPVARTATIVGKKSY